MKKYALVLAVCLLGAIFAVAQASQPSPSPAQNPSQSQSADQPQQQPSQAQPPADQGQQPSNADRSGSNNTVNRSDQQAAPGTNQPAQANPRRGTIGWGWIVVAVILAVIVVGLLSRGGSDRIERIERTDRTDVHHSDRSDRDDIRRVG